MSRLLATAAVLGAVLTSGAAVAADVQYDPPGPARHPRPGTGDYRPLPPISGTLHAGRYGVYGDRSYGPVRYRAAGPAVYDLRGRHLARRDDAYGSGAVPGGALPYGGYAQPSPAVQADAGPASYAGQGFVPEVASPGYGPVAYDQVSAPCGGGCGGYGHGYGAGPGFFTQGVYGAGPRVIAIPEHYNVGYVTVGHAGCACGSTGLFGSFGGGGPAY